MRCWCEMGIDYFLMMCSVLFYEFGILCPSVDMVKFVKWGFNIEFDDGVRLKLVIRKASK